MVAAARKPKLSEGCSSTSNRKSASGAAAWRKTKRDLRRAILATKRGCARRALWTWRPLDELSGPAIRIRTLFKHRAVAVFAMVSLALGIGANTAIYSFMDAILLRSLPVGDPSSLVVMSWRSKPFDFRKASEQFVLHSIDGSTYRDSGGIEARIFPFPAFERLRQASAPVLSTIFARFPAGKLTVLVDGEAELANAEYVSGDFFRGIALSPGAGRLLLADDDRAGAAPVAVINAGYAARRFGGVANAVGRQVFINNAPFIVVGVTPPDFDGIDPGVTTSVYLTMQTCRLLEPGRFLDPNYYWAGIMGRLRDGVSREQAQSALAPQFALWVASTAATGPQRANLPVLRLDEGAGGLDTLRRKYSKPLWLLMTMVGLILAIACANVANLQLARATSRQREIAVRLSIGAGRFRLIRQLLTESLVLSVASGALGILIAIAGTRLLTALLANSGDGFAIHANLNWRVLALTLGLSVLCGVLFGLAPAIQSTRPALVPALKETARLPRYRLPQVLVVGQIALLMLLVGAGLFARTLSNPIDRVRFSRDHLLLFEAECAPGGYPEAAVARFYDDLRTTALEFQGRAVTLSRTSLIRAAASISQSQRHECRRAFLQTGGFFRRCDSMLQGVDRRRDRAGSQPIVVISDQFAHVPAGSEPARAAHQVDSSAGPLDLGSSASPRPRATAASSATVAGGVRAYSAQAKAVRR